MYNPQRLYYGSLSHFPTWRKSFSSKIIDTLQSFCVVLVIGIPLATLNRFWVGKISLQYLPLILVIVSDKPLETKLLNIARWAPTGITFFWVLVDYLWCWNHDCCALWGGCGFFNLHAHQFNKKLDFFLTTIFKFLLSYLLRVKDAFEICYIIYKRKAFLITDTM